VRCRAILLSVLLAWLMPPTAFAAEIELAQWVSGNLDVVTHWSDVPEPVRQTLVTRWKTSAIAEPDAPFQVTDVIMPGAELPVRRLVFAAGSKRHWLVCYERGGIAHSWMLTIVPLEGGKPRDASVRVLLLGNAVRDLDALRVLVRTHAYRSGDAID
jgi:hypothetical protein